MTHPVFLIDDDADVREALALLLRTLGYAVQAFDGAAAFLQREPVGAQGCVVTDVRMAGLSGLQLLERLQADPQPLPVVVITGHGDVSVCRRAFRGGAVDFLTKPVDEQALLEAVQAGMARLEESAALQAQRTQASAKLEQLSAREDEILRLIADGLSTKEIARRLELSPRTVEKHRAGIAFKLGTGSVAEMVRAVLSP
ncbi:MULTISPECIES: response regulator [unclassified Variovorax]|uniref:response regulator transcription factor n=1 Tax=unclassified Variovorax TaxID=663243 RepID=UPI002578A9DE|nr:MULTISPECIES: response regulator [unclassified Variovorax]MDM0086161.1 response regulator [Variovorax sp. J22G40]MDM0145582.1 response regulator [Variovorax sp. J2P1-31]